MRLKAYLQRENLTPGEFGKRKEPYKHRSTIRQWAEGTRFPRDPADHQWVLEASGGAVTPADFVSHALEVRAAGEAA